MNDYEKIITDAIWQDLKKKIKGKIFVGIKDNVLKMSVKCDELYYESFVEDVAAKVMSGELTAESIARSFYSGYRIYVNLTVNKRLFY